MGACFDEILQHDNDQKDCFGQLLERRFCHILTVVDDSDLTFDGALTPR